MKAPKLMPLKGDVVEYLFCILKREMTFSECIEEMVENEKKRRLVEDIRQIQHTEDLVELFC
ncbi:MAG: hypothetical protein D5R99_04125 [Methanocalculus sp. MSAO_Arc1]|uniref:hypothetical protein n=1 Tax=Methanocalculus TaxID=71151 RepID=UPI000FF19D24|nr:MULTISPECIES: hypothetical protein [unclassified Methanocalculus]MCP1662966.1 putative CopG family antitoxin [Methanocalculus sp. AMF5]RQD80738.1 MAG: hypothetical protein D5R99_04125 [Methanocalculus sp. MSAO_Arc1]